MLYRKYGNRADLAKFFEGMAKYVDLQDQFEKIPTIGDHLNQNQPTPGQFIGEAYRIEVMRITALAASALGSKSKKKHFEERRAVRLAEFQKKYFDQDGELKYPIMGCYGIGVGRLAASVCEAKHDDYGPIWPISIAPWEVHLCCLRADDEQTKAVADDMYAKLKAAGANRIFICTTFGLFCNGLTKFDEAYEKGHITKVFTTNLNYRPQELIDRPWYQEVDMSQSIAHLIDTINHDGSISELLEPVHRINKLLTE